MSCCVHRLMQPHLVKVVLLVVALLLLGSAVCAQGGLLGQEVSKAGKNKGVTRLLFDIVDKEDDILRYGKWYGPGYWGGGTNPKKPGNEPPVDSLDLLAMKHDMAYYLAEKHGDIHGLEERKRLEAIADHWAVQDAKKLDEDPRKWPFPPEDIADAKRYRDRIVVGFRATSSYLRPFESWTGRMKTWSSLSEEGYRKQRKRYHSIRLTYAKFAQLTEKKVAAWIEEKEKAIKTEIDKGMEKLSLHAQDVKVLWTTLLEEQRRVNQLLQELEELATESDAIFEQTRVTFLCCDAIKVSVKKDISALKMSIQGKHEQLKVTLRDAQVMLERCQSKQDAEKVTEAYNKAKILLAEIDKLWDESSGPRARAENCKKDGKAVSATYAKIPNMKKDVLAKMAMVSETKEAFSRARSAFVKKEKKALVKACNFWRERFARLKWSKRLYADIDLELKRYCGFDIEKLDDEFNKTLLETYWARDRVRRMSEPLDTDKELTKCADYFLQAIEEIEQIKDEAKKDVTGAADIPEKAAQCAKISSTGKLTKPATKHYVAYALGRANGTSGEITISDRVEMEEWKTRGAWVVTIPEIATSTDYQKVYDSACAYIKQHEQGIPVGEPGKKAWGVRGWGVKVAERWCKNPKLDCTEKKPQPQTQKTPQAPGKPAGAASKPVTGAKDAKIKGAVDLQKRKKLGGAVTPWAQPKKEIRDVSPASQARTGSWAQPHKEVKEVLGEAEPNAWDEPMFSQELLKEWEELSRSTEALLDAQEAAEQMRREQAEQEVIEQEMQRRRNDKSDEITSQCQALYNYTSRYVGREPMLAYRAMEQARLAGCPRFPDALIDAVIRNVRAAQARPVPRQSPQPQPQPETEERKGLLGHEFHFPD